MAKAFIALLLFLATYDVQAYYGPDLPPGPYCGTNNQCCQNRRDSCSHRILDTMCYCDEFCNRTTTHDDCCPDYVPVCLGGDIEIPPGPIKEPCKHRGQLYLPGQSRQDDCNRCECVDDERTGPQWQCTTDECLMNDDVVRKVNFGASWKAANYTQFQGKKLSDGLLYKLGTLPLSEATMRMGPIRYDKDITYPINFDSREQWPNYISEAPDQGWCGADWAVTIASVASDRFAIQSNGAETLKLSAQTLLSCNVRPQRGCNGGHIEAAWPFARSHGLVNEACFPYTASMTRCPFKPNGNLKQDGCLPSKQNGDRTERYKVGPPGRLQKEKDIMYDIMESGPVQAVMKVHQDFFHYRGGIYRHTPYGNQQLAGLHSVRIVGWGEENFQKFWIVSNSWGSQWGENGYFRIERGHNESGIESFVVTVLVEVTEANSDK